MTTNKESRIPVGTQFAPTLISLPEFLKAIAKHSGDKDAMLEAVWQRNVRMNPPQKKPTRRQSSLPLEAAVQYGLLTPGAYEITDLGVELANLSGQDLYDRFAWHILVHCGGLRVIEGIRQMDADGLKITGDSLARFLTSQGFPVTEHNTAINSMRLWLAKAGVFPLGRASAWTVDEPAVQRIIKLSQRDVHLLASLTPAQQAFVEGLCAIDPTDWIPANQVRDWAETVKGVRFGRGSLPTEVLRLLESAGLIEYRTRGTGGGKTSELRTTPKFQKDVLQPFIANAIRDLDATISAYYQERPSDIFDGLTAADKHVKGQALEAFTIYLMRLLHLRFVGWRKRAEAEVDAVLEGVMGPIPTRWQVQCKNTPRGTVRLEDVAKEVGLLPVTRATHILFVANCEFSREAIAYAREVMKNNPVGLYLLDRQDFDRLKARPETIGTILREKAEELLRMDRPPLFQE